MNRQTFLQVTGAGIISTTLLPKLLFANPDKPIAQLSLQLYTLREAISKDMQGTLNKIAAIGFKYVETAFWPKGVSLEQASDALKKAELKVSSCHVELPAGEHKAAFAATAKAFDCKKLIWHGWPEDKRYSTLDGTKELIKIYNDAAAYATSLGLTFGLHNHWWEYRNKVGDKPVYEWLLRETDPSIFFEIDTYWVKVAGFDPAAIITQFGKRAKLLHIKDGPAEYNDKLVKDEPDPMTAVGKGAQNVPAIIHAAEYADFFVVEMDKVEGDALTIVKESYDYLKKEFGLR